MRVLLSIPSFDHAPMDFTMSLAALCLYNHRIPDLAVTLHNVRGTGIAHSRNTAVEQALALDATHLFFLDSDQTFPPDTLERLAAWERDIVGADYVKRFPPHKLCGVLAPVARNVPPGLIPMSTLPFGCILIATSVLRAMKPPYFTYSVGATLADTISEDAAFCAAACRLGHTIFMDPALTREVGHVGTRVYRPTDTERPLAPPQ